MSDSVLFAAEQKWLQAILADHQQIYKDVWLPSHDSGHHYRVWNNACKILPAFLPKDQPVSSTFAEQLLIACMFHDTGLVINSGFDHGKQSALFCQNFLNSHALDEEFEISEVLEAVIRHDDKQYDKTSGFSLLHRMLTLADDLDAFGIIGAYRYAEIYLLRGIPVDKIPAAVLNNAGERFAFVKAELGMNLIREYGIDIDYRLLNRVFSFSPAIYVQEALSYIGELVNTKVPDPLEVIRLPAEPMRDNPVLKIFQEHLGEK